MSVVSPIIGFTFGLICLATAVAEPRKDEPETPPPPRAPVRILTGQFVRCEGHEGGIGAVALSPDGKLAATSDNNYFARVWNAVDGIEMQRLQVIPRDASYGFISALVFSPDGNSIATAAWRQPVCFWDPLTGERQDITLPVKQAAYSLSFSPDGSKLAVGEHAEVKIWDLQLNKLVHDFQFEQNKIGQAWRVVFSPDGTLLAAALLDYGGSFVPKAPKVRVWNVASGKEAFSSWQDRSAVAVSLSGDGKLAAAGDEFVEVWDVRSRQSLCRIGTEQGPLFSLAFQPDGKTLLTGGNDIKLWDASTGEPLGTIKVQKGPVHSICISRDGTTLAADGNDTALFIWPAINCQIGVCHLRR